MNGHASHHVGPINNGDTLARFAAAIAPFCPAGHCRLQQGRTLLQSRDGLNSTSGSMATQRIKTRCSTNEISHPDHFRYPLEEGSRIDDVLLMIYGEYSSSVDLYFNGRLIAVRKPKTINPLYCRTKSA